MGKRKQKYMLHGRNSDIPFILIDLTFRRGAYGDFDYRVLYERGVFSGYLSQKGLKQARKFGEWLLDDPKHARDVVQDMKVLVATLRELRGRYKHIPVTEATIAKRWKYIKSVIVTFGKLYRYCEQPVLASLEDRVMKKAPPGGKQFNQLLKNERLARKYNFNEKDKRALRLLVTLGELKFQMHTHLESVYEMLTITEYIAKKYNLSLEQVLALRVSEYDHAVKGQLRVRKEELNQRLQGCVLLPAKKRVEWDLKTGKGFRKWKERLEGAHRRGAKSSVVVTGTVANPGKARGTVKIHFSAMKGVKIPPGSVVVTGMTNPQLVPYLKNAVAIVTDEGGLTCHAAIVSREMNIPCIVGTGNATQVFKDGDMVEVDADKGIVKKLT